MNRWISEAAWMCTAVLLAWPAAVHGFQAVDGEETRGAALRIGSPESTPIGGLTALERYVRLDDGAFAWSLVTVQRVEGETPGEWRSIRMTSQVWRRAGEVNIPEWTHWVGVWVPDELRSDRPILYIGGGRRREEAPKDPPRELRMFARAGAIVVSVDNVPNQPLRLGDDPAEREEDGLVSRTWLRAMETGDPTWIARFPMVKAAVRAMDAAEASLAAAPPSNAMLGGKPLATPFRPGPYLVAGGSKRGWTAWLAAAVEPRIGALAPLVIDVLDVPAQMRHHHDAYGFWAPALDDYAETGLTGRFEAEQDGERPRADAMVAAVLAHEDPIHWLSRLVDKPKYLINASGDEFFLPDSARFYEKQLTGVWRLRYVPNSGHSLRESSAIADLIGFYSAWAVGADLPEVRWTVRERGRDAELEVEASVRPTSAKVWEVTNESARDFRIDQTGAAWAARDLEVSEGGVCRVVLAAPERGYRAGFVELTFAGAGGAPLVFTTRVFVTPETLPHAKSR